MCKQTYTVQNSVTQGSAVFGFYLINCVAHTSVRGSQMHILKGEIVGSDVLMTYGMSGLLAARYRKVHPNCSKQSQLPGSSNSQL